VEDLRPVNESQLDSKHKPSNFQEERGGEHTWPWWRVSVMWR
jgi:enterochelin esterase-like enzyme